MTFNMERIMELRKVALLTLIVAVLLSGAALAGGLLNTYTIGSSNLENNGVSIYSRAVVYQIINI